jgi:hypothetical protein
MTAWQWLQSLFGQRKYFVPVAILNPGDPLPRDFPKTGTRLVYVRQTPKR